MEVNCEPKSYKRFTLQNDAVICVAIKFEYENGNVYSTEHTDGSFCWKKSFYTPHFCPHSPSFQSLLFRDFSFCHCISYIHIYSYVFRLQIAKEVKKLHAPFAIFSFFPKLPLNHDERDENSREVY